MVYYIYKRGARMYPDYYVISPAGDRIPVTMREAQKDDYEQTTYDAIRISILLIYNNRN